jgi:hypothetical protein
MKVTLFLFWRREKNKPIQQINMKKENGAEETTLGVSRKLTWPKYERDTLTDCLAKCQLRYS